MLHYVRITREQNINMKFLRKKIRRETKDILAGNINFQ
jgi:hypothetical protein